MITVEGCQRSKDTSTNQAFEIESKEEPENRKNTLTNSDDESEVKKIDVIFNNSSLFNNYSLRVYLIIMLVLMTDGAEATIVSFLINVLEKKWYFSTFEKGIFGSFGAMGSFIGGMISGSLSDVYGRKPLFIIGNIIATICCFLSAFSQGIVSFAICRCLYGFGIGISIAAASSLVTEISSTKRRALMLATIWLFFPLGEFYCAIIADYFLVSTASDPDNWRKLIMSIGVPCFISSIFTFFVDESPRFLLQKKRYEEAFTIIDRIKQANLQGYLSELDKETIKKETEEDHEQETGQSKSTQIKNKYKAVFSSKFIKITIFITFINFICATSWNGLSYIMPKILIDQQIKQSSSGKIIDPHAPYHTFMISALLEIPCTFICSTLADLLGRKFAILLSFLLCLIPGILIVLSVPGFYFYFVMIRFVTVVPWGIIYIYTNEVYPTKFRTTAIGLLGAFSKISSLFSPTVMILLYETSFNLPFMFVSILFSCGVLFAFLLPYETKGLSIK